jgi:lipopolysaccharide exporter
MNPSEENAASPDRQSNRRNLADRALNAAKWNYLGVLARIAIQLVAQIVLARLVGPSEFGYYSLVFMVVGIAYILTELGLSSALIQSRDMTDGDIRYVWTRMLVAGFTGAALLLYFADTLANLLQLPEAAPYLQLASIPLVVQLLSAVPLALLRKELDFKSIQFAQVSGMLIGQVGVGFALAWMLHSAYAIVIAWTVQLILAWAFMYRKTRHSIKLALTPVAGGLSRYGVAAWTANIANWGIENLHMLAAGRFFGAATLGHYSVSSNLVRYPTNHLVTTLQSVMFPASAAAQDDPEAVAAAYLAVLALVGLLTIPTFVACGILAHELIVLLYGPTWSDAALILLPLALAMPLHSVTAVSGPILWGIGRVGREALLQWLTIGFFVLLLWANMPVSVAQLAWIVLASYFFRAALISSAVASILKIKRRQLLIALRGGIILGAIAAGTSFLMHTVIGATSPLGAIAATVPVVVALSLLTLWYLPRTLVSAPLARAIQVAGKKLPAAFANRLSHSSNKD